MTEKGSDCMELICLLLPLVPYYCFGDEMQEAFDKAVDKIKLNFFK